MLRAVSARLPLFLLIPALLTSLGCSATFRQRALYHLNPANYKTPLIENTVKDPVFIVLVAAAGLSFIEKHETQDWFSDHEYFTGSHGENAGSNVREVLRFAGFASLTVPQLLGGSYVDEDEIRRQNWHLVVEGAEVGAETFLWNRGLTSSLKAVTDEDRPTGRNDHSFPSGHTSVSFAGATLIERALASEIEINGWDPQWRYLSIVPYAAASWVAVSRVEHDEHYLPDVLAGAALGRATANIIYDLHYEIPKEGTPREKRENMLKIHGQWIPLISHDVIGIQYSARF